MKKQNDNKNKQISEAVTAFSQHLENKKCDHAIEPFRDWSNKIKTGTASIAVLFARISLIFIETKIWTFPFLKETEELAGFIPYGVDGDRHICDFFIKHIKKTKDTNPKRISSTPEFLKEEISLLLKATPLLENDLLQILSMQNGPDEIVHFLQQENSLRGDSYLDYSERLIYAKFFRVLYRCWKSYFIEHKNTPETHLWQATFSLNVYSFRDKSIWRMGPFDHFDSRKLCDDYLFETLTEAGDALIKEEDEPYPLIAHSSEKNILLWKKQRRKKIRLELSKAYQLSNKNPVFEVAALLIFPNDLFAELFSLCKENSYYEVRKKSVYFFNLIQKHSEAAEKLLPGNKAQNKNYIQKLLAFYLITATYRDHLPEKFILQDLNNFSQLPSEKQTSIPLCKNEYTTEFIIQNLFYILDDCTPVFFAKILVATTGFLYPESIALIRHLELFFTQFYLLKKEGTLSNLNTDKIQKVLTYYPGFQDSLQKTLVKDGEKLFLTKMKMALTKTIQSKNLFKQTSFEGLTYHLFITALDHRTTWFIEKETKGRLEERNLVISELSHHIKNLNATIREPLENLRNQPGIPKNILEDALRGTNLIRNIVNAMNLSIGSAREDFTFDATHLDDEPVSLKSIIWSALFSTIPNMFDGKHFSNFLRNYFPTRELFFSAKNDWAKAIASENKEKQTDCLLRHFFDLTIEFTGESELLFGNTKGSATKMLILCQEIIMNAVKYASTIERKNRIIKILLTQTTKQISITVENSCKIKSPLKTSGLGHTIIKNFAQVLGCDPLITKENNCYTLSLKFDNFSNTKLGKKHENSIY